MSEAGGSQDVTELSIEETNKLRAKLGLKPLEIGSPSDKSCKKEQSDDAEESYEKRGEIFVKTTNISDKQEAEKLRERIAIQKEKRLLADKLRSVKTIADEIDDDDLDPFAWVNKSRESDKAKQERMEKEAKKKREELIAKQKALLDRQRVYNETSIKGLKVNHSLDTIAETSSVILTLKDREILDEEGEDELENVNLKDDEKARENVHNKKHGKKDYNPYETQDALLSKYDEKVKDSFRIGGAMAASTSFGPSETTADDGKISLESLQIKFASEFYTPEEMEAKFKKRKKKVSKKSFRKTTSDDLVEEAPKPAELKEVSDAGEPRSKRRRTKVESTEQSSQSVPKIKQEIMDIEDGEDAGDDELDNYIPGVVDDEGERELQEALEKARRKKQPLVPSVTTLLANLSKADSNDEPTTSSSCIILDSTAEFCRTLGETNEAVASTSRVNVQEDDEGDMEVSTVTQEDAGHRSHKSSRKSRRDGDQEESGKRSSKSKDKWQEVKISKDESTLYEKLKSQPILEEEPDVSLGVASALQLAYKKGYLDKEAKKSASAPIKHPELLAKGYSIEEKFREDDRRGHRNEGRGYSAGPVTEFREKSNYKPDVKLEYVDDNGRMMNQKEAFRILSHKFHGKGPGKNKIDKRMKKLEQESKLRQMSCIDTPLNTVEKLQEKQKELQLPYVVISGTGSSLVKK